jgi:hypothetical protein
MAKSISVKGEGGTFGLHRLMCHQDFFTNHTLTGQGQRFRTRPNAKSDAPKVCWHQQLVHSAVATAKSIFSPMRCLTSLSHALGLAP